MLPRDRPRQRNPALSIIEPIRCTVVQHRDDLTFRHTLDDPAENARSRL